MASNTPKEASLSRSLCHGLALGTFFEENATALSRWVSLLTKMSRSRRYG